MVMDRIHYLWFVVAQVAVVASFFAYLALMPSPAYQVINCDIAEISPDFTTEMRQACRSARNNNESKK